MLYSPVFKKEYGKDYQDRLSFEFSNQMDRRLVAVYYEADDWLYRTYGKRVVITCINRTPEENKKVNGSKWSGHLFGRAYDWRTFTMDTDQIKGLQSHLTDVWGSLVYVLYHDAGHGSHLHVGIPYKHRRSEYDE